MKELILSAGMQRSGSTWLYNATRLILRTVENMDLGAGWIGDFNTYKNHDTVLIKLHEYEADLAPKARFVAYSFRDVRDSLASMKRKYNSDPSIQMADSFIENDKKWRKRADFILKYEDMINYPEPIIDRLSESMGISDVDSVAISNEINAMSYNSSSNNNDIYNLENLLHDGHFTDGRHGTWKDYLPIKLIQEVETKYTAWLNDNGYPLSGL